MAAIASAQVLEHEKSGLGLIDAANNGFHLAFLTTAAVVVAVIAAIIAFVAIKKPNKYLRRRRDEEAMVKPAG